MYALANLDIRDGDGVGQETVAYLNDIATVVATCIHIGAMIRGALTAQPSNSCSAVEEATNLTANSGWGGHCAKGACTE